VDGLTTQVDNYCERTGPELWSEPFNAASNLAFILAKDDRPLRAFGALVIVVGIGSATFHTIATLWAMAADVIPIGICLVWYIWAYLRYAARMSASKTWACLVAFGVVSGLLAAYKAPSWLNETHQYFGAFFALLLLAWYRPEARRPFVAAAVTFALSMTFRTLDLAACDAWPLGTHFLWHSLNGVAFYFAARAYTASARI
jgi:hypothetical protein